MEEADSDDEMSTAAAESLWALRSGHPDLHKHTVRTKFVTQEEKLVKKAPRPNVKPFHEGEEEWNMITLQRQGKISFWGGTTPITQLKHKYSYTKHLIGERPVWAKIYNVERMKRVLQIRKLMSIDYMAKMNTKVAPKRDIGEDWFKMLQRERSKTREGLQLKKLIRPRVVPKDYAIAPVDCRELDVETEAEEHKRRRLYPDAVTFSDLKDYSDPLNCKDAVSAPFETPYEAAHKKNNARNIVLAKFQKINPTIAEKIVETRTSSSVEHTVLPPEAVLRKKIRKFAFSEETHEVLANFRLAEYNPKRRNDNKTSLLRLSYITLRRAVFTHDWALVAKACEIISQEINTRSRNGRNASRWSLWNGGLLALANIYKNDASVLTNFAKLAKVLLKSYPPRIGIDVATWLTQKGQFTPAVKFLQHMQDQLPPLNIFQSPRYDNPRMKAIKFATELYTAINEYALYKYKSRLAARNELDGDSTDLYEYGVFVIGLFELLESRGDDIDNDCTIFIEPLIDLTLALHGKVKARETFERICTKNDQNGVLTDLFLQFLLQYFPEDSAQIQKEKKKLSRYDLTVSPLRTKLRQHQYNRFLKKLPTVSNFKQLPKPAFSW